MLPRPGDPGLQFESGDPTGGSPLSTPSADQAAPDAPNTPGGDPYAQEVPGAEPPAATPPGAPAGESYAPAQQQPTEQRVLSPQVEQDWTRLAQLSQALEWQGQSEAEIVQQIRQTMPADQAQPYLDWYAQRDQARREVQNQIGVDRERIAVQAERDALNRAVAPFVVNRVAQESAARVPGIDVGHMERFLTGVPADQLRTEQAKYEQLAKDGFLAQRARNGTDAMHGGGAGGSDLDSLKPGEIWNRVRYKMD